MKYFKVEFTIKRDGEVEEKVIQGSGKSCLKVTKKIEEDLGGDRSTELLPEYHQGDDEPNNFLTNTGGL
ncbi:MAG: DUF2997 domain-containing protein [Roseofilum sp. SID3]|uniref:DUF2997 domain-containing protein n=1 Tax=Roseofilum sp. SID3 TaxID=2821499 RepID=UPI001B2A3DDA|nr:DUF2997 domain-containing protein [Roseofilum sp. SID3]MBP0015305.1 DUF2997 domain-containing protein [Roseofilum sp. SID3]